MSLLARIDGRSRAARDMGTPVILLRQLLEHVGSSDSARAIRDAVGQFERLSPHEQADQLPRIYFLLEDYFASLDPPVFERDAFRAYVRASYAALPSVPGFEFVFSSRSEQVVTLGRRLLADVVDRASILLDDSALPPLASWLRGPSHALQAVWRIDGAPRNSDAWRALLARLSRDLKDRLLPHFGAKKVSALYSEAFERLGASFVALDAFGDLHELLPEDVDRRDAAPEAFRSEQNFDERLHAAERMATMGMLTASVAHELNNPLSYVGSNIAFALAELKSLADSRLDEVLQALADAGEGVERARAIVRDLRRLAKGERRVTGAVDLEDVLETSIKMTWTELRKHAEVERCFVAVPKVVGERGALIQVFVNLLVNAAQAAAENESSHPRIVVSTASIEGMAVVSVRDTGRGISPDLVARVFDPFFTTKPDGLGLGLSISRDLIEGMGGTIRVQGGGDGTNFEVALRCVSE